MESSTRPRSHRKKTTSWDSTQALSKPIHFGNQTPSQFALPEISREMKMGMGLIDVVTTPRRISREIEDGEGRGDAVLMHARSEDSTA